MWPARGFLLVAAFLQALDGGDPTTAFPLAREVAEIGRRFDDKDLLALGVLARGQGSLALGDIDA